MSDDKKISFWGGPSLVCSYCKHLVKTSYRDGYFEGCALITNQQGQFARQVYGEDEEQMAHYSKSGIDTVDGQSGCDKFASSGLPAHPQIHPQLVKANPLASTIPVDPNATETSWDFDDKQIPFLSHFHYTYYRVDTDSTIHVIQ